MSGHTAGYEVDASGHVFSVSHNWRGYGRRELAQHPDDHGYPSVRLTVDGKRTRIAVHRLVSGEFLPQQPSPKHEIRHLNGNQCDNRAENLAWGTRKENAADRDAHGRTSRGLSHSMAVRAGREDSLSDAGRLSIRRLSAKGWTQRAIAERLGRSQSAIGSIIRSQL
jgi:hypothetical protein